MDVEIEIFSSVSKKKIRGMCPYSRPNGQSPDNIFGSLFKRTYLEIMAVKDGCIEEIFRRKQTRFSQINTYI